MNVVKIKNHIVEFLRKFEEEKYSDTGRYNNTETCEYGEIKFWYYAGM